MSAIWLTNIEPGGAATFGCLLCVVTFCLMNLRLFLALLSPGEYGGI